VFFGVSCQYCPVVAASVDLWAVGNKYKPHNHAGHFLLKRLNLIWLHNQHDMMELSGATVVDPAGDNIDHKSKIPTVKSGGTKRF